MPACREQPVILILDDNDALLGWLDEVLQGAGFGRSPRGTAAQARDAITTRRPTSRYSTSLSPTVMACRWPSRCARSRRECKLVLMTGTQLSQEEITLCERYDIPVLRKPFLGQDAITLIQSRLVHTHAGRGGAPIAGPDRA